MTDYTEAQLRKHIPAVREWLGNERLAYLIGMYHGARCLTAANMHINGGLGMHIRNKMRELMGTDDQYPEHFFDNNWETMALLCIGVIE